MDADCGTIDIEAYVRVQSLAAACGFPDEPSRYADVTIEACWLNGEWVEECHLTKLDEAVICAIEAEVYRQNRIEFTIPRQGE
jgi:hypothetical protein